MIFLVTFSFSISHIYALAEQKSGCRVLLSVSKLVHMTFATNKHKSCKLYMKAFSTSTSSFDVGIIKHKFTGQLVFYIVHFSSQQRQLCLGINVYFYTCEITNLSLIKWHLLPCTWFILCTREKLYKDLWIVFNGLLRGRKIGNTVAQLQKLYANHVDVERGGSWIRNFSNSYQRRYGCKKFPNLLN